MCAYFLGPFRYLIAHVKETPDAADQTSFSSDSDSLGETSSDIVTTLTPTSFNDEAHGGRDEGGNQQVMRHRDSVVFEPGEFAQLTRTRCPAAAGMRKCRRGYTVPSEEGSLSSVGERRAQKMG